MELTKREMFAMAAMQGLLATFPYLKNHSLEGIARSAVAQADALIAALAAEQAKETV